MKKRKLKLISVILFLFCILFFSGKEEKNSITWTSDNLAIMLEVDDDVYEKSQSNNWPDKNNYVFNSDKSYCVHGSTPYWNGNSLSINYSGIDKCFIYFSKVENITSSLKERLLTFNFGEKSIKEKGLPDFTNISTTNEGLYSMYDDDGISYYFRGAVDNNWVYFAGIYWKIIRINGDGSVRLIYIGTTAPNESRKVVMTGSGTHIGTNKFGPGRDQAEYVGYVYELSEHRGTTDDSEVKILLEDWYRNNLSSYDNLIHDAIFCNDRISYTTTAGTTLGGGTGKSRSYFAGRIRNETNKNPTLVCLTKEDAFTKSNTEYGNGLLDEKVGLINVDEVAMAGMMSGTANANKSNYLHTNNSCWTMSPAYFSGSYTYNYRIYSGGYISSYYVDFEDCIRPVISLKPATYVEGNGEYLTPYVLVD